MAVIRRRAISIQQPWAWLIAHGFKDIENRNWHLKANNLGTYLIHAGLKFDKAGYEFVKRTFPHIAMPEIKEFEKGGIVGVVDITSSVECEPGLCAPASAWYMGSKFAWGLELPMPLEFKPAKGKLGIFYIEYPTIILR